MQTYSSVVKPTWMQSCAPNTNPASAATRPHRAWLRKRPARVPMLAAQKAPHAKNAARKARPAHGLGPIRPLLQNLRASGTPSAFLWIFIRIYLRPYTRTDFLPYNNAMYQHAAFLTGYMTE